MAKLQKRKKQPKAIASAHSLSAFVKSICDIMRRSNCASALQYVPELTWILFLRILDAQETKARDEAEAVGAEFAAALASPFRWQDWAAPPPKNDTEKKHHPKTSDGKPFGLKRQELFAAGEGKLFDFINKELLPHLHGLDMDARTGLPNPAATPKTFDYILTNPPFGGKEGKDAQKNFAFETGSTQVLFVQDILSELAPDGTCAIVLDEGLLFRTNESAFVETKRKLVDECDLWAIVSLPGGVFSTAGAGVKTNLLFFTKGGKTEKIWYYDLSQVKVGKKNPLTLAHFGFSKDGTALADVRLPANLITDWKEDEVNAGSPFPSYAKMLKHRGTPKGESRYSWTVDFAARRAKAREEMAPLLNGAARIKAEVVDLKEQLKRLKMGKTDRKKLSALNAEIKEKEKAAKDLENKAAAIDGAVFDLKAVNPNNVAKVDERTPQEIIESIDRQGRIVSKAMKSLTALLAEEG